jgi:hypothetical protein
MMSVRVGWGGELENGKRVASPGPFVSCDLGSLSLRSRDVVAPDAADEGRCAGPPCTGDEEDGIEDDGVDPPSLQSELRERNCEAPPDGSKPGAFRAFV